MPANTGGYGWPYPIGTDRVQDGDNAIAALAEAIEDTLQATPLPHRVQSGIGAMGAVNANTGVSLAVTFAVGRFSQAPQVVTGSASSGYGATGHAGSTASGVTLRYYNPTGTNLAAASTHWFAVQMGSGGGPGFRLGAEPFAGSAYVVTCHTEGCPNAGEALEVLWDDEVDGEFRAACGVCGEPITDTAAAAG